VFLSLSLVVGIVVGGLATIQGAVWGALFIQFMPNVADQLSKAAPWAIYGLLLIVFTVFMPGGIASLTQQLGRKRPHQTAAGSVTETMEDAR
jgi:branched-chain amino acid transport system permease protein